MGCGTGTDKTIKSSHKLLMLLGPLKGSQHRRETLQRLHSRPRGLGECPVVLTVRLLNPCSV